MSRPKISIQIGAFHITPLPDGSLRIARAFNGLAEEKQPLAEVTTYAIGGHKTTTPLTGSFDIRPLQGKDTLPYDTIEKGKGDRGRTEDMTIGELIQYLPEGDFSDFPVVLDFGEDGRYNVGSVQDIAGSEPVDTVIEAASVAGTHPVTSRELRDRLADQDQDGRAQLYLRIGERSEYYYTLVKSVKVYQRQGCVRVRAGAYVSGGDA